MEKHLVAVVFNARQKAFVVVILVIVVVAAVVALLFGGSSLTLSQSMERLQRDNR